jgi:ABC-type multidrug transport system fused ATPase/permease subunit
MPTSSERINNHQRASSPNFTRPDSSTMHGSWGRILYVIEDHKSAFFLALLFGLLSNAFISLANPLALKYLFDEGIIRKNFTLFASLGLAFVAIFTLWRLGVLWSRLFVQRLKNKILVSLSLRMLGRYYNIPYREIITRDNGYFLSRVYDEVNTAVLPIVDCLLGLFNAIVSFSVALAVVLFLSWRATLVLICVIPIVYWLSRRFGSKIKDQSKLEKEEEAKLRGVLGRALGSYKITKTFDLYEGIYSKTSQQIGRFVDVFYSRFRTATVYQTLSGMFMSYAETAVLIAAGYEILVGRMSFGGFMGFMNAFWFVIGASKDVFERIPELSRLVGAVERLIEFQGMEKDNITRQYGNKIEMEDVSFAYNGDKALRHFSLKTKRGERLLIVGPNGSGKSTLAHLMAGFLYPTTGNLKTLPLERISAIIFPFDFIPGSIMDNVGFQRLGNRKKLFEELTTEFGLTGQLDKDPVELSAGQRKRLELVMGLLKDAEVYIFDEPLSGVDVESKDRIIKAIFQKTQGKTLILIMHGDTHFHHLFDRVIELGG